MTSGWIMQSKPYSRVDLHLHTYASDGRPSPQAVVEEAKAAGMELIAITDHDGTAGIVPAVTRGRDIGISVLPGIELSTGHGEEVHILGYGHGFETPAFDAFLAEQQQWRIQRMEAMLEKLHTLGMDITAEEVRSRGSAFLGRVGLADAMTAHGYADSIPDAFARYLNDDKPAFVPRKRLGVAEGIAALRAFGAVVILAHPGRLKMGDMTLSALLPEWIGAGLCGLEAYHSSHDRAACERYSRMARSHGLLVTGGSDSHGRPNGAQIGEHLRHWHSVSADTHALLEQMVTK